MHVARPYPALAVAEYIISECNNEGNSISNLRLQKILYFIQREFLQKQNRPFFADEIEAWKFGPVVPAVYWQYCAYGNMDIRIFNKESFQCSGDEKQMVDSILKKRGTQNVWELVDESHKKGGAWERTFQGGSGFKRIISKDRIRMYG